MSVLKIEDITKSYDDFQVLQNVTLEMDHHELGLLSGINGSGKSTLLQIISGIIRPTEGKVTINGYTQYEDEVIFKKSVAYVPDVPRFYTELTTWEHCYFIATAHRIMNSEFEKKIKILLTEFGLWDSRNLFPQHYSRGMRLKLGLILAFIRPFDVLILDEPTSALDQSSIQLLRAKLLEYKDQGATILLSSHDPNFIDQKLCRVFSMNHGELTEL